MLKWILYIYSGLLLKDFIPVLFSVEICCAHPRIPVLPQEQITLENKAMGQTCEDLVS